MPTYEYSCSKCGAEFEAFQSMKDAPLTVCPKCKRKGGVKRRIGGGAGLIFKGSGFYITDYKKSSAPAAEKGAAKESAPKESKPAAPAAK